MATDILTIVVPFVDGISFLKRTLDSIVRQRDGRWRAILGDNTRDAATRAAAEALVASYGDDRIAFARHDVHLAQCANFNRCLELCDGELVTLTHSDDELLEDYVGEALALAARRPNAAVLFFPARIIDDRSRRRFSLADFIKRFTLPRGRGDVDIASEDGLRALVRGCFIMAPTVVYRMPRLAGLRWDETLKMSADLDLWARVLLAGETIAGTRAPHTYAYRRHGGSLTAGFNASLYRFEEEAAVYDRIAARAAERGWPSAARVARAKTMIRLHLLAAIAGDAVSLRWSALATKRRFLSALK